jgi:hypothetical protein
MLFVPASPVYQERNHGEQCMPDQHDRAQIEADRHGLRLVGVLHLAEQSDH